jgi:probable F420-dependent oxidoreductase
VHLGAAFFATDLSSDIRDVARAAEDAGLESLFVAEHTHIPVSRQTPYPAGGELPEEYSHTLDPFLALTAAAGVTERLRVGTGVCLVVERDPIVLAKEVATLDWLTGGDRVLFGVGAGWNLEEMVDHGTDPTVRWPILRERMLAMQQLWTASEASYRGEHVSFPPAWQWPKPVTRPYPPVLVGGGGRLAMRHALEYGSGWMPMPDPRLGSMGARLAAFGELAAAADRPTPPVTLYAVTPDTAVLAHYAELGVERCVCMLPPVGDAVSVVAGWRALAAAAEGR